MGRLEELKTKLSVFDSANTDLTEENGLELVELAEAAGDDVGVCLGYTALSSWARNAMRNDDVIKYTNKLYEKAKEAGLNWFVCTAAMILCSYYTDLRQESLAIRYCLEGLGIYYKENRNYEISCALQNMANIYVQIDDAKKAEEHFTKSAKYIEAARKNGELTGDRYKAHKFLFDLNYNLHLAKAGKFDKMPESLVQLENICKELKYDYYMVFIKLIYMKYYMHIGDNKQVEKSISELLELKELEICGYEYLDDLCVALDYSIDKDRAVSDKLMQLVFKIAFASDNPGMIVSAYRRAEVLFKSVGHTEEARKHRIDYFKALKRESTAMDTERHMFVESTLESLKLIEKNAKSKKELSELEYKSFYDALTGVGSRYALEKKEKNAFLQATADGTYYSVIIIDLDRFKNYNDTFGHLAGDHCLQKTAEIIKKAAEGHYIGRFGGDEFFIIAEGLAPYAVKDLCIGIQERMASLNLDLHSGLLTPITLSIGFYSAVPKDGETHFDYIDRADDALYRAKNTGRDRIIGNV